MAMAVLLVISSIVSLAVARALTAQGEVKNVRALSSQMASLLNQAATNDYDTLLDGSFSRPSPCPDNPGKSCVTLGTTTIEVSWDVQLGADDAGNSTEAASSLEIANSATLPSGRELNASKRINAPVIGWRKGYNTLRVNNIGASYSGPLFLMSGNGPVSSAFIVEDTALIRVAQGLCTVSAPCRIALTGKGATSVDGYSLSAADISSGYPITLTPASLSVASVDIEHVVSTPPEALPASLDYSWVELTAASTAFTQTFMDADHAPSYPIVTVAPTQGTLYYEGNPVGANTPLATVPGQTTVDLVYTTTAPLENINDSFTYTLYGTGETTTVHLSQVPQEAEMRSENLALEQGTGQEARMRVYGTDGQPYAGAVLTLGTVPAGVQAQAQTATTDSSGWAVFNLDLSNAPATNYTIPVTSDQGKTGNLTFAVKHTLSDFQLSVSGANLVVNAYDSVGAAMNDLFVSLKVESSGELPRGIYLSQVGCTTNASGHCQVTIVEEATPDLAGVSVHGVGGGKEVTLNLEGLL